MKLAEILGYESMVLFTDNGTSLVIITDHKFSLYQRDSDVCLNCGHTYDEWELVAETKWEGGFDHTMAWAVRAFVHNWLQQLSEEGVIE